MSLKLKPLGDRLIVRAIEEEETTASGLVLPDTAKEKPQKGKVVAVGDGPIEDGKRRPLDVSAERGRCRVHEKNTPGRGGRRRHVHRCLPSVAFPSVLGAPETIVTHVLLYGQHLCRRECRMTTTVADNPASSAARRGSSLTAMAPCWRATSRRPTTSARSRSRACGSA